VENFEVSCITHTSYIDTTEMISDLPEKELAQALADPKRQHGALSPTLRKAIVGTANGHGVLSPEEIEAISE
jgi:hypothetical protein